MAGRGHPRRDELDHPPLSKTASRRSRTAGRARQGSRSVQTRVNSCMVRRELVSTAIASASWPASVALSGSAACAHAPAINDKK